MSKKNVQTIQHESNDEERFGAKSKWSYSEVPDIPQNRTCCSPVDEIDDTENEETSSTTHSVEVQTDKSSFFLLKQEKKIDSNKKNNANTENNKESLDNKKLCTLSNNIIQYRTQELENVKLTNASLNYEEEKIRTKLAAQMSASKRFDEYAETDLDQPMDYALCYNETNLDEEKKGNPFLAKNDLLCVEELVEEEKVEVVKPKGSVNKEQARTKKEMFGNTGRSFKEIFNFFKDRDKKRSTSDNIKSNLEGSKLMKSTEIYEQKIEKLPQSPQTTVDQYEKETKLKNETQFSQQTPLMFSRCSSLGSLNGFEQNSINDDKSSIISDISRRTSGVVSPSELPDSPAQTAASGIKFQQKTQIGCFGKKKIQLLQDKFKGFQYPSAGNDSSSFHNEGIVKKLPVPKKSFFEDNITSFKDESTPTKLHSMAASSLSSLTIDDDDDYELINKIVVNKENQHIAESIKIENNRQEPVGVSNQINLKNPAVIEEKNEAILNEQDQDFNEEEDDELTDLTPCEEQVLDQCIRKGIAKWTKRNVNEIKSFSWDLGLTCRSTRAILRNKLRISSKIQNDVDYQRNYQTSEIICNNNNLNLEQKPDTGSSEKFSIENADQKKNVSNEISYHINENSYYITYEEHLLDQCIRRGMAKITKKNINDIRPFSWDVNQICLTTRAMILHGRDIDMYSGS